MSEQTCSIGPLQNLPTAENPTASRPPDNSRWSRFVNVVCATVLVAALGNILWLSITFPKLQQVEEPDRALDLMVGRTMEAQDALRRAPVWQQWLAEWTMGSGDEISWQAIEWYRELVETTDDPLSKLRLAILLGESGREAAALAEASGWQDRGTSAVLFGQLIEAAYGAQPLDREQEVDLQAMVAETLPNGWFYDHLAVKLAQRAGNQELLATVKDRSMVKEDQSQQRIRPLLLFELICLVVGSVMLLGIVRLKGQRVDILRLHSPGVPPPWSGGIAAAVILRGGALGVVTMSVLLFAPSFESVVSASAIPLAYLPLLAIAYVRLLKPSGLTFSNGFGLHIKPADVGRLVCIILAVVAAGIWGEWMIGRTAEFLHLNSHWTEWFDKDLVWASPTVLASSLLQYVIFAPIFEELAFRGLLYAMLRRRFSFFPAALISAGIFALAHGYSLIGFISVFWSGFLWAWIYERTGSLVPGMAAHAMNNLLVCLTVMALLR